MKTNNALVILSLVVLFATNAFSQDFYDINTINTIELTFAESNWDALLDQLVTDGNEERLLGTAVVNGVRYDSVGVRYKGNSSYNSRNTKNPLNIKLDYVIDDQEHEGYGTLKLANAYKDPSFVREVLSYEIARKYFPASQSNYANVYINGTHLGLYTSNQDVDKHFMRSHFASDENARFKGEISNNTMPGSMGGVWEYFGTDSASYFNYYALESDFGWRDLIAFLDTLNNYTTEVEQVLNVDRHLWFLAFQNLLVNLDSPINNPQNYYIYKDDAGRFNPIPWDLNESFGVFTGHQTLGQLGTRQLQELSPFANMNESEYPIISKILSNSTYRKMYVAHMKTIMADYFENGLYRTRALEIQGIIDSEVLNDPNTFFTYSQFQDNIDNSIGGDGPPGPGNQSIVGITELMDARVTYLNSLADFQAADPVIFDINNSPSKPSANSNVWITAHVTDAESVQLAYRSSQTDTFNKIEMLDDGNNNDGSAGDGIYGASVPTGASGFQYYVYAENSNAASFSPARAAYEFYTLTVSGDLVINEFMASNESTVADATGEFDDWIELYNNTDETIQLEGYFLSDDSDDLAQWAFPDTFIAANSYVIVWADKDEGQEGLHADFKLSGSGESIFLVNSDTIIVDEVTFGEQISDISTGRFPNGTGAFVQMSPTFAAQNEAGTTGGETEDRSEIPNEFTLEQNYPNPFNPTTTISFSLPAASRVTLKIYNTIGQLMTTLVDEQLSRGNHKFQWKAANMSSGIYFYTLKSGSYSKTKQMLLLK